MQDVEKAWLTDAQQGDADAISQLVEVYQRSVYNLCYRMLGDAYEAEDAAQETFLRAYKSIGKYDPEKPFSTWLLSIAAHYCIDQIRRQRMKFLDLDSLPGGDLQDDMPNPETVLSTQEEQRRVHHLLESLKPIDRAAVIMYYWHDSSYEQIAETLDLTESAVKSRLHRAKRELAQTWVEQSARSTVVGRKKYESPAF